MEPISNLKKALATFNDLISSGISHELALNAAAKDYAKTSKYGMARAMRRLEKEVKRLDILKVPVSRQSGKREQSSLAPFI